MKKTILCALFIINGIFYQACAEEPDFEQNTECQIPGEEITPSWGGVDEWVYDFADSFSSHFDQSWLMFRTSEFIILYCIEYYNHKVQGYISHKPVLVYLTFATGSFVLNFYYDVNASQYAIDARQRVDSDLIDGTEYDAFNTSLKEGMLYENDKVGFFMLAIKQLEHLCTFWFIEYLIQKSLAISCDQCGKSSIYPVKTKRCGKHFFCSECFKSGSFLFCSICTEKLVARMTLPIE